MNRRTALTLMIAVPFGAQAQSASSLGSLAGALKDPLIGMLTSKLGVTENQAKGGMGSYLTLAKEKLAKGDFDKIVALVPGASKYMDTARQLGAVAGPIGNAAGLNSSLGKLGMNQDTAAKFAPTVTDYIGKAGGSGVKNMLSGLLQ